VRLRVEAIFDAATALPGHDRCEGLHGHTYTVEVTVTGKPVDGVLVDFNHVKRTLRELTAAYDHQDLSKIFEYPSCERVCLELCRKLHAAVPHFEMVRVWEGAGKWVEMDVKELPLYA
jgi:6-pyruvoyltetrahydropterin/6-carboxytetrahydropterin synthase